MTRYIFTVAAALLCSGLASDIANAQSKPSAADTAWINGCIAQRKSSGQKAAKLKTYCTCMQRVVENNQAFATPAALASTYPPAHQKCWDSTTKK